MPVEANAELRSFGEYVINLVESGNAQISPEDAVLRWRKQNLSPEEFDEEVAAIREALDDMEAGDRGTPWQQVLGEINAEFGLKPRQ
jgi:hypothetical protein